MFQMFRQFGYWPLGEFYIGMELADLPPVNSTTLLRQLLNISVIPSCKAASFSWLCAIFGGLYKTKKIIIFCFTDFVQKIPNICSSCCFPHHPPLPPLHSPLSRPSKIFVNSFFFLFRIFCIGATTIGTCQEVRWSPLCNICL